MINRLFSIFNFGKVTFPDFFHVSIKKEGGAPPSKFFLIDSDLDFMIDNDGDDLIEIVP